MNGRELSGSIRKLTWGLIPNLPYLAIQIGGKVNTKKGIYFVTNIVEDKGTFLEYGYFEYLIYVSKNAEDAGGYFWKRITLRPDGIEYFLPDGSSLEEVNV